MKKNQLIIRRKKTESNYSFRVPKIKNPSTGATGKGLFKTLTIQI